MAGISGKGLLTLPTSPCVSIKPSTSLAAVILLQGGTTELSKWQELGLEESLTVQGKRNTSQASDNTTDASGLLAKVLDTVN